ncbi:MAG: nitroreductase family protein [Sphaerochaetaceae bacterium]
MAILPEIERRRAYRALSSDPIDKEVLTRLAQAAHMAPSSANNQPWRIVTIADKERLEEFHEVLTGGNYWAKKAPAISAFVTNPAWSLRTDQRDLAFFELGMAAMAYQIQATSENLIAHPIIGFDYAKAKKFLGLSEEEVLEVLIIVGKAGDTNHLSEKHKINENSKRDRKALDEIFSFDLWNKNLARK